MVSVCHAENKVSIKFQEGCIDLLLTGPGFFLIKISKSTVNVGHIKEWQTFFSVDDSEVRKRKCHFNYKIK